MVAVGVAHVLVDTDSDLNELVSDAVELRGGTSGALESVLDLSGAVGASRGDAAGLQHGVDVDLVLKHDGLREVAALVGDGGRGSARTVLVELVRPEALLVIFLQIWPHTLERGDQIRDLRGVELGTAVGRPRAVVVLRPEAMNHPIREILRVAVAVRRSAH